MKKMYTSESMSSVFKSCSEAFKMVFGKCDKAVHCCSTIGKRSENSDKFLSTENPIKKPEHTIGKYVTY